MKKQSETKANAKQKAACAIRPKYHLDDLLAGFVRELGTDR